MPSLREVRQRITTIKSTRQITGAMKMVAASKLHKAQQAITHLRIYEKNLARILREVNRHIAIPHQHPLIKSREMKTVLIISIASNKGLCGSYNAHVLKRTLSRIRFFQNQDIECKLLAVGKKTELFFQKRGFDLIQTDHEIIDKRSHNKAKTLTEQVLELFKNGKADRVEVIYHRFKNAAVQELCIEQLLPLSFEDVFDNQADEKNQANDGKRPALDAKLPTDEAYGHILEPCREQVISKLVDEYLHYHVFRIVTDATASEHGARMTSMHNATDNADQLLKELTITYNKVRQGMITRELMEIVAATGK